MDWLSIAEFAHNNRVHSSTGHSPFFVNFGFHPSDGINPSVTVSNESASDFVARMQHLREEVSAALKRASDLMKAQYDRHRTDAVEYKAGDLVWLNATNIPSDRPSKKLDHKNIGPYVVDAKVGRSSYRLRTPGHPGRHVVFNKGLLRPFKPGTFPSQQVPPPPPPELIGDAEEWEVESVKDSRFSRRQLQYLVHWKGYDVSEDSWEPAKHLEHAPELVQAFHDAYPHKPRPRQHLSCGHDS